MTLAPDVTALPAQAQPQAEAVTYTVAEFFAGIGLARMGLEQAGMRIAWANDMDPDKQSMYLRHFGEAEGEHYKLEDIKIVAEDPQAGALPRNLGLAWASFPCTDLSLAGGRAGLKGNQSGTFWHFTDVLEKLGQEKPPVVALENVNGFATSHNGEDIKAAIRRLNKLGYSVDVLTLDARSWVPQSRPRLFLVASQARPIEAVAPDSFLRPKWLNPVLNDPTLVIHRAAIPTPPPFKTSGWTAIAEDVALDSADWWDASRVARFEAELSPIQKQRVEDLSQQSRDVVYRTAYRRTRDGKPAWEIRADDIAGCLRTARGGSSKQAVVRIKKGEPLHVRWMTPLEYARLMGAGHYVLPERRSQAVMGFGDAVCVDAVRWLAEHYLVPLLNGKLLPVE